MLVELYGIRLCGSSKIRPPDVVAGTRGPEIGACSKQGCGVQPDKHWLTPLMRLVVSEMRSRNRLLMQIKTG
jgi:hypothetical protein